MDRWPGIFFGHCLTSPIIPPHRPGIMIKQTTYQFYSDVRCYKVNVRHVCFEFFKIYICFILTAGRTKNDDGGDDDDDDDDDYDEHCADYADDADVVATVVDYR